MQKRIETREKTIATKNVSDKFKADTEKMKEQLNDYREGKQVRLLLQQEHKYSYESQK